MNLSQKALSELKDVLKSQMSREYYEQLSDEDIRSIGEFVMTVMVSSLKIKRSLFKDDQ